MVEQQTDTVTLELSNDGLKPVIIGEGGTILEQYPKAGTTLTTGSIVFLKTDGEISLPSFANWSLRNVVVYKTLSKLPIEIVGEGYVESQSVSEGAVVLDNAPIVVKLKTPEQLFTTPVEVVDEEGEQLPQD